MSAVGGRGAGFVMVVDAYNPYPTAYAWITG